MAKQKYDPEVRHCSNQLYHEQDKTRSIHTNVRESDKGNVLDIILEFLFGWAYSDKDENS